MTLHACAIAAVLTCSPAPQIPFIPSFILRFHADGMSFPCAEARKSLILASRSARCLSPGFSPTYPVYKHRNSEPSSLQVFWPQFLQLLQGLNHLSHEKKSGCSMLTEVSGPQLEGKKVSLPQGPHLIRTIAAITNSVAHSGRINLTRASGAE